MEANALDRQDTYFTNRLSVHSQRKQTCPGLFSNAASAHKQLSSGGVSGGGTPPFGVNADAAPR